jgi:hypothetical protein
MTLAKHGEDDFPKAPTVVGVWKYPDLIRSECLVYAGDIAGKDNIRYDNNVPNTKSTATTTLSMRRKGDQILTEFLSEFLTNSNALARVQTIIMTVRSDVVYSDDETYGQKQVPDFMTDNNKHHKDNQLAGNSSLRVHARVQAVMPAAIPKGGVEKVVCRGAHQILAGSVVARCFGTDWLVLKL